MKKVTIFVVAFLLFGALIIYEGSPDNKSFLRGFGSWVKGLFGNVRDVTGHAVNDYSWLPENNLSKSKTSIKGDSDAQRTNIDG